MQSTNLNKRLIEGYLELFNNLSPKNKEALIAGLLDSLKPKKSSKKKSLKLISGDFIEEKSAEQIIAELRDARSFTRSLESF